MVLSELMFLSFRCPESKQELNNENKENQEKKGTILFESVSSKQSGKWKLGL